MKRNKIALILTSFVLALSVGTFISVKNTNNEAKVAFATYTNGDGATYYNSIDDSKSGNALLTDLRSLNLSKRKSTVGYSSMGTSPSGQYKYTDYDPNYVKYDSNGQPYGTQISSFYTFTSATSWNREHVWPNSHGGGSKGDAGSPYPDADIHMPRPTVPAENSSRGNSFFVEGMNHSSNGWDPYTAGYSAESRGEAARITFYCTLVNSKLILAPNNTTPSGTDTVTGQSFGSGHTMGNLETLIKWNINYPVSDREKNRNEGAEYLQGNRNPFIDHPEYACKIWGNVNNTIKSMCSNASYPTAGHTAGIRVDDGYNIATSNTTAYTLKVGDTVNFLPFVDGAYNASVSWSLTDYSVTSSTYYSRGSYTNGVTIEGLSEGVSTLTLTYSYDDNGTAKTAIAQVIITVNSTGGGSGEGGGDASDVDNEKTATYTVSSTSAVTSSGTVPSGSSASYSQTYSTKGQITSGKNAILTLSGYDGKVITGITLNMKSNGSSGGGSFTAVAGSTNLANTSGGFNSWYDNDSYGTSYRDVHVSLTNDTHITGTGENITLTITGSTNSLYINSYTITYGDPSGGSVDPEEVVLSSISASGMTTTYEVGDTFSFDGVLKATYSDGNIETVIPDSVSTPDMSTSGNKTITLTYSSEGVTKTTSYIIYVVAKQLVLSSIELNGQTTSYYVGDKFTFTGTCTARYEDTVTSKNVTPTSVSSPDMTTAGNKTITVSYTENGVTKTATYTINVQTVTLTSITLGGLTTEYYVGDSLVKPTVTASYNNGTTAVVTEQATFTGFDSSAAVSSQTITVSFGGLSKTYTVSISEKPAPQPSSGDYEKITSLSDIEANSEIIMVTKIGSTNYAYDGRDSQNGYSSVTISSNKIAYSESTAKLACIVSPTTGGYTVKINSSSSYNAGKYISGTSGSNTTNFGDTASTLTITAATNTGRKEGGTWDITSNTSVFSFNGNTSNYRYRFYKSASYTNSGMYAVDFYMRSGSGETTEKTVSSIEISNAKTSYVQGDTFVKPTVTAHYDDGSSAVVTTASFSGYDMTTTGNQTVTAHYTENGVTVSVTYSINVVMNTTVTTPLSSFYDGTITLPTSYSGASWYDIKGVVVGVNGYTYYIQEGEYGFCVYGSDSKHPVWYSGVSVGDYVMLHVKVYKYNGLVECDCGATDSTVTKLGTHALPDANEYTSVSDFMAGRQSTRTSLLNLKVDDTNITKIAGFSGTSTADQSFSAYDLNKSSDTVTIFIHKGVNSAAKTAIVDKLKTITEDDTVEFLRCVAAYHNGNQISLSSADQIVIHSPSEDKLAAWGVNYLFIGDPAYDGDGTGACKTANLYKDAKTALLALESEQSGIIETLQSDSTYEAELARYLAWARACEDSAPFVNDFTFMNNARTNSFTDMSENGTMMIVVVIAAISALAFTTLLVIKKKRK